MRDSRRADRAGWALVFVAALGVLLVAVADNTARGGSGDGRMEFWAGLAVIYAPIAFRLFGRRAGRRERLALVLTLGLALYVVKVLQSPAEFVRFDEFGWWRAVQEVITAGHAFTGTQLNAATAGYPALSVVTAAIAQLSGLSIFHSGLILIGIARLVFVLCLFLFLERLSGSSRAAGVGVVVYACNSSFLYFDAQFGYESLALAMALAFLLIAQRWARSICRLPGSGLTGIAALIVLLACGLTVSHHVTSVFTACFCLLWSIAALVMWYRRRSANPERGRNGPFEPTLVLTLAVIIWMTFIAGGVTLTELGTVFTHAFDSARDLILGVNGSKHLFASTGEETSPVERLLMVAGAALTLLLIAVGIVTLWKRRPLRSLPLALAVVALLYPASLGMRLTEAGSSISGRVPAFAYIGVAFLAALLVGRELASKGSRARGLTAAAACTALALIAFIGNFMLGELKITRQPGPFLVGAEGRSISPAGVAAAHYAGAHLSRGSHVATDRTDAMLFGSYGGLNPIFGRYKDRSLAHALFDRKLHKVDRQALRGESVKYVVIDRRLSRELPAIGYYIAPGEPYAATRRRPVSAASLAKFEGAGGFNKLYDNGPVAIYEVVRVRR